MTIVLVLLAATLLVAGGLGFPYFLQWLAEENILLTTVEEGTAKAIMRSGTLVRFVMSFKGYHLNQPGAPWYTRGRTLKTPGGKDYFEIADWEVIYHGNKPGKDGEDDTYDDRPNLLKHLGLYWVGFFSKVHVYEFEWNEPITSREDGKERILPRSESTDFIYVADFTYATIATASTKDRLPIDTTALVTVAIRNPYRALFSGEDWLRRVTSSLTRYTHFFIGAYDYQKLITPEEKPDESEVSTKFSKPIIGLTDKLPDDTDEKRPWGLHGRYGAEIRTADLQTSKFSGAEAKEFQEAAAKVYIATQNGEATKIAAAADAKAIEVKGEAEAKALGSRLEVIEKHGENGIELARLDAMQASAQGPGNTVIVPLAAFAERAKAVAKAISGETS